MLFVIDIGNTNTSLGVFDGETLTVHWRLTTARARTVDEWGVLTRNLFAVAQLDFKSIDAVAIASVVPPLNFTLKRMIEIYFQLEPLFVDHTTASAAVARELDAEANKRGFKFIDAPVSGGQAGAENGILTVMCGGKTMPPRPSASRQPPSSSRSGTSHSPSRRPW